MSADCRQLGINPVLAAKALGLRKRLISPTAALAFLSGVTDIDPFILFFVNQTPAFQQIVVTAILLSMCGNTIMKGLYFGTLSKETRLTTFWRYGLWALLHIPVVIWW